MAEKDLVIINVLPAPVGQNCLIPGSVNVLTHKLEEHTKDLPKDAEIIIYSLDYSCPFAPKGYNVLVDDLGFTNVHLYPGGIAEWFQAGELCGGPCDHESLRGEHPEKETPQDIRVLKRHELKKKIA